jgi:Family of unknown function (DUF6230)
MRKRTRGLRGRMTRELSSRAEGMVEAAETTRTGTRRRAAVPFLAGLAALGSMFGLVGSSVLAVNFTSSNQSYKIFTDRVVGQYAAGYLNAQQKQNGTTAVAQLGFQQADLYGLCAIATQSLAGIGDISLIITGGEPVNGTVTDPAGKKITANQLFLASNSLVGNGENISKMTLGQSADTLSMGAGNPFSGTPGAFGLQAELMQIGNLDGDSYGIDLQGQINLPDLKIRVLPGLKTKTDCAS